MIKYQAIIFDGGGVIFTYSFDNTFNYWAWVSGKNINEIKNKFTFDKTFQKLERGEINCVTFRKHVLNKLNLKINMKQFDEGWNSIYLEIVPGIKDLLQQLRLKYRLVVLTNTNEIHAKQWKIKYAPLFSYFERVFSSYEIHARKPEKEAYNTVLNYLQLHPENVIFLDDNPDYVQAASKMKITGIYVTSFSQMVEELNRLGIQTVNAIRD